MGFQDKQKNGFLTESQTFSSSVQQNFTNMEIQNLCHSALKTNQSLLSIPAIRLSSKSVISYGISSRSFKDEQKNDEISFDDRKSNLTLRNYRKVIKKVDGQFTPNEEKKTKVSYYQDSDCPTEQNCINAIGAKFKNKRSYSTTLSPKLFCKLQQRFSEDINPSFVSFPNLPNETYSNDITQRRQLIQKTKKQVEQFNQKNFKLLNDIMRFREEMSKRNNVLNTVQKLPSFSVKKICRKNGSFKDNNKTQINFYPQQKSGAQRKCSRKNDPRPITDNDFEVLKKLGSGTFATVYLAIEKRTGFLVTLKKISRGLLKTEKCLEQLIIEIKLQMYLNHPNVLKIYGFYVDQQCVTLILELMQEGNMYEKLMRQGSLRQEQASQAMSDILHALEYLHENNIVHRDLKPQNVLVSHGVRKLCDLGTANICVGRRSTLCGTLDYSAPELIEGKEYNIALDLWSVGVMAYELLTSKTPFYHIRRKDTIKQIAQYQDGEIKYPQNMSISTQKFIAGFLVKDPENRVKIADALNQEFILNYLDHETTELRQKYTQFQTTNK